MDQKPFVYNFNQALNSSNNILNDIQFAPIPKTLKTELNKISKFIQNLVQKLGQISATKLEQENYFLYNSSNMINKTFYTKLNKNIQTYGLISHFNKNRELFRFNHSKKQIKIYSSRRHSQRGFFPSARKYKIGKSKNRKSFKHNKKFRDTGSKKGK